MFHIAMGVAYCYLLHRFVLKAPIKRLVKVGLVLLLLFISQYHLLLKMLFGNMFSPEMPSWAILLGAGAFCYFIILFLLIVLLDLNLFIQHIIKYRFFSNFDRNIRFLFLPIFAFGLTVIGVYQAIQIPQVKQIELPLSGLSKEYDGLRVVQLTDLHLSPLFDKHWASAVTEATNELKPDVILITGDLIDGTVVDRTNDIAPLAKLQAPLGVYASVGNHEYYFDAKAWEEHFKKIGMTVLSNESLIIGNRIFNLAAVTDESATDFGLPTPNVNLAVQHIDKHLPTILLKHQPLNAAFSAQQGVQLQLSGHTHGGMIKGLDYFLGFFNQGFISGLFQVDSMNLYVSNGTGLWNGFQIRLGVPAEITLFKLRSAPTAD